MLLCNSFFSSNTILIAKHFLVSCQKTSRTKLKTLIHFKDYQSPLHNFCRYNCFSTKKAAMNEIPVKEVFACNVNDMKDGEMKEIDIGETRALLVKDKGNFSAIGHKCTHYGAPLVKGVFKDGYVRCPWHGACFNTQTGDIEDFPGLDCVPKHEVYIKNGNEVIVKALQSDLKSHKRAKKLIKILDKNGKHFLIVGGGPTSVTCAETLRQNGFTGKITIASMDSHLPYDRYK